MLHELGHLTAAAILGYKTEKIVILPIGVNGKIKEKIQGKTDNFIIAIAGPLVNMLLALCTCRLEAKYISLCNIYILILNLLPIPPLDGSRVCDTFFESTLYNKVNRMIAYVVVVLTILFDFLNNHKINIMLIWIMLFTLSSGTDFKTIDKKNKAIVLNGNEKVYELLKNKQEMFIVCEKEEILGVLKYEDIYNAATDGLYYLNTKELIAERTKNGYQRFG